MPKVVTFSLFLPLSISSWAVCANAPPLHTHSNATSRLFMNSSLRIFFDSGGSRVETGTDDERFRRLCQDYPLQDYRLQDYRSHNCCPHGCRFATAAAQPR